MINFTKLISTFFYIGYFPKAPGSAASAVGILICYLCKDNFWVYGLVFAIITMLGFMASGQMEKFTGKKDPGCVVIDEVSGMMIAFFMLPFEWPVMISAFFLFRAFDMFKIYPAYKMESLPGAAGIMMDDIVAGIYTNLVMQVTLKFTGIY